MKDEDIIRRSLCAMILVISVFLCSYLALPYFIEKGLLWKMVIKRLKYEEPEFSIAIIKIERHHNKDVVYIQTYNRDEEPIIEEKNKNLKQKLLQILKKLQNTDSP